MLLAVHSGIKQLFDQNEPVSLEITEVRYLHSGDGVIGVGTAAHERTDLERKIDGSMVYALGHGPCCRSRLAAVRP